MTTVINREKRKLLTAAVNGGKAVLLEPGPNELSDAQMAVLNACEQSQVWRRLGWIEMPQPSPAG